MTDMISLEAIGIQFGFTVVELMEGLQENPTIRFFSLENFGASDANVITSPNFRLGESPNSKLFVSFPLIYQALGDS